MRCGSSISPAGDRSALVDRFLGGDLLGDHAALGAEDLGGGGIVGETGEPRQVLDTPVRIHL